MSGITIAVPWSEWENVSFRTKDKSKIVYLSEKLNSNMLYFIAVVIKSVIEKKGVLAGLTS